MIAFKEPLVLADGDGGQYSAYVRIAAKYNVPMQLSVVNREAAAFVREAASSTGARIVVAGTIGPNDGDEQAAELASAGVDLLFASSFPSIDELHDAARAMGATKLPFALAPMVRDDGTMMDGTPLASAIARLDEDASARPWHYMLACVSVSDAARALESLFRGAPALAHRVVGLKANASPSTQPDAFARDVWECAQNFGLHVLGGCAGTDTRHIAALAAVASNPSTGSG